MALAYYDRNVAADDFSIGDFLNDTEFSYTDIFAEELTYILHVYLTPILIIIGVIGNLLSIIVFYKSKLRRQSTSQYLSALAVSDTIFLLQLIPPWLKAVKASLVFVQSGFCQLFVYLTYVSSTNSSWLVVAFTVERFVAVIYPLRSRACTVRRARVCIACVGASCVALNTPVLWLAEARGADCDIDRALLDHAARFNLLDTVLSFTLPLAFTTVLNVWIMVGVCRGSRARHRLTRNVHECPRLPEFPRVRPSRARRTPRTRSHLQRSQQRITRMLLLVSSVFVLLNLPAYSMRILAYAMNMSSYEYSGRWAAVQQICQLLFHANFGINFFLYCLSGQNFRLALLHTFPRVGQVMLRKLCCFTEDQPQVPPPRPSVTNSASVLTEATMRDGEERIRRVSCWTHDRTSQGRPIMRQWHFRNIEQMRDFQNFNLERQRYALPIRSHPPYIRNGRLRAINEIFDEVDHGEAAMLRPIPFNPIPGEIAPLSADPIQPSPGLASASSPLLEERSDESEINDHHDEEVSSNESVAAPQEREIPCAPASAPQQGGIERRPLCPREEEGPRADGAQM